MRRNPDRQETSLPSSTSSSLYLKPQHLQDRDSGYNEADSDYEPHYPQPSRVNYPFSDDEEPMKQPTWSMASSTIDHSFQTNSTSLSLSSIQPPSSPVVSSLINSTSYHSSQADNAIASVQQYTRETDWKKVLKHKSGVVVYMLQKQTNGEKMAVFKGESVIQGYTPQSVFYVIGMRKLWDDLFEDGNLVQNLNETTSITYEAYRSTGSSRAYDLTLVEKIDCSNDGVIVFACTSVETSKAPKVPGRTRNEVKLHGWILRLLPTTPPSTHVTFITEEFVRGWIPGLTKKSLARKPLVIASIDNYLKKKAQASSSVTQQPHSKPTNKLLSPLSAYTRRRPSIMEQQSPPTSTRPLTNSSSILTNPPPRRSSLNPPQTTTRSSSLNKRITFAEDTAPEELQPQLQQHLSSTLQVPSTTSTNAKLYPPARHRSARKESLISYKRLFSSDMEEWKELGERDGVKMYSKASQGYALPILRGDGWLEGSWTAEQVCSVVQCFGAKTKWDEYFDNGQIVERFSQKEYLVYMQMRSIFPINSRDFSLLTQIDSDARSETIHVVSTSVSDNITPEIETHTRGKMLIYGWTFQAIKNEQGKRTGIKITSIAHMDLAGTTPLPSAIIRLLTTEVPLCVLRVQNYITSVGCPPYVRRVAGKVVNEHYDPDTHEYKISYIAKHLPSRQHHLHNEQSWCTDIRTHSSVYKNSFNVVTRPQQDLLVVTQPNKSGVRIYTKKDTLDNTIIEITITPAALDTDHTSSPPPLITAIDDNEKEQSATLEIPASVPTTLLSPKPNTDDTSTSVFKASENIDANQLTAEDGIKRAVSTATTSVHPLMHDTHQKSDTDTNKEHKKDLTSLSSPDASYPVIQSRQRSNSIIIIGDQLSFNGPQLSVILLLMAISYYVGKFSCHC
ncbi:unnamed protein product [Absidia cylindrospora]